MWLATSQFKFPCCQLEKSYLVFIYNITAGYQILKSIFHLHISSYSWLVTWKRSQNLGLTRVSVTAVKFLTLLIIKTLWLDLILTLVLSTIKWLTGLKKGSIYLALELKTSHSCELYHSYLSVSSFHQFYGINIRALSQYKDRLIYVWRFPC